MKVVKGVLPEKSLAEKYLSANYLDVYKCTIKTSDGITPDDVQVSFWTVSPPWVETLFKIRNSVANLFGLKGDKGNSEKLEECIRKGGSYNVFTVTDKSDEETVLKLHDKHLDAYLSVCMSDNGDGTKDVSLITIVQIHNLLGYFYFYPIMPFHKIVVKGMLKFTVNRLINPNKS